MGFSEADEQHMRRALVLAEQASQEGEVPVGAVLTLDDKVIAEGFNQPIALHDPTAHAEIAVLRKAAATLKNYRLLNTTLYVTLEPCAMCAGALVHARVKRVVFAASDLRAGACSTVLSIANSEQLNHRVICEGGLFADEAKGMLQAFFKARR